MCIYVALLSCMIIVFGEFSISNCNDVTINEPTWRSFNSIDFSINKMISSMSSYSFEGKIVNLTKISF